jgi:glycosyltransferase involved in cell wall biosynthesis
MKKILYIVSTLKRSGPTNQLFSLVKCLDRNKFEPHIVTLSPELTDSRLQDFEDIFVKTHSLNLSRMQGVVFAKLKLKNVIANLCPDLIHSQGIRADMLVSSLKTQIPKVCTIHNNPYEDYVFNYGVLFGKLMAKIHMHYLKNMDFLCAVSKAVKDIITKKCDISIDYIRNGVEHEKYKVRDKRSIRDNLGLPQNKLIFIFVGHLSVLKDPLTVIEAFRRASRKDSLLIFLGDGPLMDLCLSESCDSVQLLGRVDNVEQFLSASDIYISSSHTESFQLSVTEAVFSGTYCFLSDLPVRREMRDLGLQFELFDVKDVSSLCELIGGVKPELLHEKIMENLEVSLGSLTAEAMTINYQSQYERLLVR